MGRVDLHQGDDGAAGAGVDVGHLAQQRVARVDEVVAEEDGEGLVADVRLGAQDGVAEAPRVALADVVHGGEVAGFLDLLEPVVVTLGGEGGLQLVIAVEVVFQGPLVTPCDHEDVVQPCRDGLLDHVLDGRLVHDGEHFLGRRLRRRKEAGAEARGRDDCLFDHGVQLSHGQNHSG